MSFLFGHCQISFLFLVLWFYSIEPPLYFQLNEACRQRNWALLDMLGPFAWALAMVLSGTETMRGDRAKDGMELHCPEQRIGPHAAGWMAGSRLVFRGSLLSPSSIAVFAVHVGRRRWSN